MEERSLTVSEAAEQADAHVETVRRWIKSGRLPARKTAGGHHRILQSDLDEIMAGGPARNAAPKANDMLGVIDAWTLQADDLGGWRPPKRMSEDDLAELRYKLVGFDGTGGLAAEVTRWATRITEELHRRDNAAATAEQRSVRPICFTWTEPASVDTYDDLVDWQAGRCAICAATGELHNDFDPATGDLRGLVCSACLKRLDRGESAPILDAYRAQPPAEILYLSLDAADVAAATKPKVAVDGGGDGWDE